MKLLFPHHPGRARGRSDDTSMNHLRAGTNIATLHGSSATIDQAQEAMRHLEALLQARPETAIAGPAEVYYVLGVCQQIMATWQHSSRHLESWLDDQHKHGRLAATDGPFIDDPAAAVATAAVALQDTRRASTELRAALERAQLAITELSTPTPPRRHHPKRS